MNALALTRAFALAALIAAASLPSARAQDEGLPGSPAKHASSAPASPSWARTVTYTQGDVNSPQHAKTIRLDLASGTFTQTEDGKTVTGQIVGSLRTRLAGMLANAERPGTQTYTEKEPYSVRFQTIQIEGAPSAATKSWTPTGKPPANMIKSYELTDWARSGVPFPVAELSKELDHALFFTRDGWPVVGAQGDNMTAYFDKAPVGWFGTGTINPKPGQDNATGERSGGGLFAMRYMGAGPLSFAGEVLRTLQAYVAPDAYNKSQLLSMIHDRADGTLGGDVSDAQILARVAQLQAETKAASVTARTSADADADGVDAAIRARGAAQAPRTGMGQILEDRTAEEGRGDRTAER